MDNTPSAHHKWTVFELDMVASLFRQGHVNTAPTEFTKLVNKCLSAFPVLVPDEKNPSRRRVRRRAVDISEADVATMLREVKQNRKHAIEMMQDTRMLIMTPDPNCDRSTKRKNTSKRKHLKRGIPTCIWTRQLAQAWRRPIISTSQTATQQNQAHVVLTEARSKLGRNGSDHTGQHRPVNDSSDTVGVGGQSPMKKLKLSNGESSTTKRKKTVSEDSRMVDTTNTSPSKNLKHDENRHVLKRKINYLANDEKPASVETRPIKRPQLSAKSTLQKLPAQAGEEGYDPSRHWI